MNILIVDDHALVGEGIGLIIQTIRPGARVVHAATCQAGLAEARSQPFDLALLDLNLPDMSGFVALERLRQERPELPVVAISGREDRATVLRSLDLGAKAFIPKSADTTRFRRAIEAVFQGKIFLPESVTAMPPPAGVKAAESSGWDLTDRQREVLSLLLTGLPNKLIARRLDIAESTVKIHVSAILRELKVTSRTQALIAAARADIKVAPL